MERNKDLASLAILLDEVAELRAEVAKAIKIACDGLEVVTHKNFEIYNKITSAQIIVRDLMAKGGSHA